METQYKLKTELNRQTEHVLYIAYWKEQTGTLTMPSRQPPAWGLDLALRMSISSTVCFNLSQTCVFNWLTRTHLQQSASDSPGNPVTNVAMQCCNGYSVESVQQTFAKGLGCGSWSPINIQKWRLEAQQCEPAGQAFGWIQSVLALPSAAIARCLLFSLGTTCVIVCQACLGQVV